MAELPFLVMDKLQAARFRDETSGDDNRLEPREITAAGPHKGKFALPERVLNDPNFAARRDALLMLGAPVVLDTAVAFVEIEDEG
jgi:hypothetical protein